MRPRRLTVRQRKKFQSVILAYYRRYGRHLPWREHYTPYRVVVSEIMLQQTQVDRVVQKYREFIKVFPDFVSVAGAPLRTLLGAWQGLGYNRRILALRKLSERVIGEFRGKLPSSPALLRGLPGIGAATASSISAFAFNKPVVFIETNIRSVFIHFFFRRRRAVHDAEIFPLIEQTLDRKNPRLWYSALMDYGAMLKKKYPNPSRKSAHHVRQSPFRGSRREVRGKVLRLIAANSRGISKRTIFSRIRGVEGDVEAVLAALEKEGFIRRVRNGFVIH